MKIFAQLRKVDEEKRLVYGVAAAETADRSGEILDYATTKPYFEKWVKETLDATDGQSHGNLRAMHGKVAAGKLTGIEFDDDHKQFPVVAKVVDDNEWKKVLEGVYTGFSIGGSYVNKWDDPSIKKSDGKAVTRYTAAPNELSLVDRPCIPNATFFEVQKSDGSTSQVNFQTKTGEGEDEDLSKSMAGDDVGSEGSSHTPSPPGAEGAIEPPAAQHLDKKDGEGNADKEYMVEGTEDEVSKLATTMSEKKLTMADVLKAVDTYLEKSASEVAANEVLSKEAAGTLVSGVSVMTQVAELLLKVDAVIASGVVSTALEKSYTSVVQSELVEKMAAGIDLTRLLVEQYLTENLTKVAEWEKVPEFEGLIKFAGGVEKIGARNSASDKSRIQKVHDLSIELGGDCEAKKSDGLSDLSASGGDLQKMVQSSLAPLQKIIDEQAARLAKLEAQPAPSRATLRVVSKAADILGEIQNGPEVRPVTKGGVVDEPATDIKKIHQQGGIALGWSPGGSPLFNHS